MTDRHRHSLRALLWTGFVLFVIPAALRTYLMMPLPGSQELDVFALPYYLDHTTLPLRIFGAGLLVLPVVNAFRRGSRLQRIGVIVMLFVCGAVWYVTEMMMSAQEMFREPQRVEFANVSANQLSPNTIVLGISINGITKAYPVRFLAYHHKVHDSLGSQQVLVTYCSVCRSGRVYEPYVDGRVQHFRLTGMRHYNAVIEDNETKSWWYQATGEAVIGPRTGMHLPEIPSAEMTLRAWTALHPETLIMQPDPASAEGYASFGFDKWDSARPPRAYFDSVALAWKQRSWVVGVTAGAHAKAFAWSGLMRDHVVNDSIGDVPIAILIEPDSISFHVWSRDVHGTVLTFMPSNDCMIRDATTGSTWDCSGTCTAGPLAGQQLTPLHAHREYWHSWKTFHPATAQWTSAHENK